MATQPRMAKRKPKPAPKNADEEYFQEISQSLIYSWRRIRSMYPKNLKREEEAIANREASLKQIEENKRRREQQGRRRAREPAIKYDDDEPPSKRQKIAHNNNDQTDQDILNTNEDAACSGIMPPEVVSLIFEHLDLVELYQVCLPVSRAWKEIVYSKIEPAFKRLNEEIKIHTAQYPRYMACEDYFTRVKKLMPHYNSIILAIYHRIKKTLAIKKDKRELFTISVEDARDEIDRKASHLFSFDKTGYIISTADGLIDEEMPIGCSKLGGTPDLPPSMEWPADDTGAFPFVAQIRLDELSLVDISGLFPSTGMLYIFHKDGAIYYDGDKYSIRIYVL